MHVLRKEEVKVHILFNVQNSLLVNRCKTESPVLGKGMSQVVNSTVDQQVELNLQPTLDCFYF